MAGWDSYTQKATPEDNDTLMIKDSAAGANKRTPFSGVWNWMLNKLANAVISQLETSNKSIIPAINELNSKSYSLRGGTSIPANSDLNNYTTPGNYYCSSSNTTPTLINAPFKNSAFVLKVLMGNGTNYPTQVYEELITGKKAYRCYASEQGGWKDYVYFSDDATIFVGTAIQSGDDLNDYTTPGIYRSTSSSITASLLNIPEIFGLGFAMLVFNMSLATNVQVIFAGDKIYMRFSNTSGWQTWFKYSGTIISS